MHHPQIGHVHLTVSDLEKSVDFYTNLLGFEITTRYGDSAIFLSFGGYHHHLGLNTWAGTDAPPPAAGTTGLYHFAVLYPTRKSLAEVVKRLNDARYVIDGASDHGVSEAVYLRDPDGIGVEIYVDRPESDWPRNPKGEIAMVSLPLSLDSLLSEL